MRNLGTNGPMARLFGYVGALLLIVLLPAGVLAQADDPVSRGEPLELEQMRLQIIESGLESERGDFYKLMGLEPGDTLYVYVTRTSGNLDSFLALSDQDYDGVLLRDAFWGQVDLAIERGADPLDALPGIYASLFVAWDDDGGNGYDAAMVYEVPEAGEFQLLVTASPASLTDTFGDYRLTIGVNEPEVLTGEVVAEPMGEAEAEFVTELIAVHDRDRSQVGQAVQIIVGELAQQEGIEEELEQEQAAIEGESEYRQISETFVLADLNAGDELKIYADVPAGGFKPVLVLEDFGGKPVASDNLAGTSDTAELSHYFAKDAEAFRLTLVGLSETAAAPKGEYRLVLTVNAPAEAVPGAYERGRAIIKEPIKVAVGMVLQQITDVDQVSENFGAVAELTLEWNDPVLAYSPDSCNCTHEVYTGDSFSKQADERGIDWPQFTVYNQQGNRWVQNRNVVAFPDGAAFYQERFTTDFQAPDFNFRKFPFDSQTLYMRVHSLYSDDRFVYVAKEELSGIGDQLGEEEWQVTEASTEITTSEDGKSEYALRFVVKRYLQFYIFRIFVPIILIIIVSWFIFFLKDYGKRVDVAGANLLVFVAFNFTVSGELPRLGYLTFMDAVLIGVFVISAFVVVFNVYLKRLELAGKHDKAARIDRFSIWLYPLVYGVSAAVAILLFLVD